MFLKHLLYQLSYAGILTTSTNPHVAYFSDGASYFVLHHLIGQDDAHLMVVYNYDDEGDKHHVIYYHKNALMPKIINHIHYN